MPLLLVLAACRGTQPYSSRDLSQVHRAYASILPAYLGFKQAYTSNNAAAMRRYFAQNEHACKLADSINARDSIDPNVNLFLVTNALDDMCNNVESVYASWELAHHLPYDKTITAARPQDAFLGMAAELQLVPKELKRPAKLS